MVRAKFYVDRVASGDGNTLVELWAITREDTEENKAFWKYTPSGFIQMTITNPAAVSQFKEGAEYYIDFTPAD